MTAPVDKEELKKLYNQNYLQPFDKWTDDNIQVTSRIITRISRYLHRQGFKIESAKKSLDIGCAKGYYTESLRWAGFVSYGLDYSDNAIEIARKLFPLCKFSIMDGFDPDLNDNYDFIFMKGFSGTNTHDLGFVIGMCNKYIRHLNPGGWLVVAYSSDYSGFEKPNETANWNMKEIEHVSQNLNGVEFVGLEYFSYHPVWRMIRFLMNSIGIKRKSFFYMMFKSA